MTSILVGRDPDPGKFRIIVGDDSVSRTHAQITASGATFLLEDMNSANGTYVRDNQSWRRIAKVYVSGDTEVRLGRFVVSIGVLMRGPVQHPERAPVRHVERNPETGEIIQKGTGK